MIQLFFKFKGYTSTDHNNLVNFKGKPIYKVCIFRGRVWILGTVVSDSTYLMLKLFLSLLRMADPVTRCYQRVNRPRSPVGRDALHLPPPSGGTLTACPSTVRAPGVFWRLPLCGVHKRWFAGYYYRNDKDSNIFQWRKTFILQYDVDTTISL